MKKNDSHADGMWQRQKYLLSGPFMEKLLPRSPGLRAIWFAWFLANTAFLQPVGHCGVSKVILQAFDCILHPRYRTMVRQRCGIATPYILGLGDEEEIRNHQNTKPGLGRRIRKATWSSAGFLLLTSCQWASEPEPTMSRSPYSLLQSQGVCRNRCERTNIQEDASIQVTWHENHKKRGKSCWIQNVLSQLKNLTEMKAIHMFTNHLWFISLVSGNSSSENNRKYKMSYMHTDILAALFFKRTWEITQTQRAALSG